MPSSRGGAARPDLADAERPTAEIIAAHGSFAAAMATGTWGLALPVARHLVVAGGTHRGGGQCHRMGRRPCRNRRPDRALSEAAIDLHGRAFGVAEEDSTVPLTLTEDEQLIALIRKGRQPLRWRRSANILFCR